MKLNLLIIVGALLQACSQDPLSFNKMSFAGTNYLNQVDVDSFDEKFKETCKILTKKEKIHNNPLFGSNAQWQRVCKLNFDKVNFKNNLIKNFDIYEVISENESLFTGYYAPFFKGSKQKTELYESPLNQKPKDLYTLETRLFDNLEQSQKLIVRVDEKTKTIKPYFKREDIYKSNAQALVWMKSPVDNFFLQIQGSGFVELPTGEIMHVAYNGSNGHKYRAIGRDLIQRKYIEKEDISMDTIREFLEKNPQLQTEILNLNPRYIFFKEGDGFVKGSLGTKLKAQQSLAVDPSYIPLGLPVFLKTNLTYNNQSFESWMFTEDTGAAIKGGLRGDIYFGKGELAGQFAGRQNAEGNLYIVVPK